MALLFMDGFDHYAAADMVKKWTTVDTPTMSGTSGRRGGGGVYWTSNGSGATKALPSAVATIIVGFAFKCPVPGGTGGFMELIDNTTTHLLFIVNADGSISVCLGTSSTVLGTTAAGLVLAQALNYFEVKATIHNTTGSVIMRLNGAHVLSLSNCDTQNAGSASVNLVRIQSGMTSGDITFDDFYMCDTSGSTNNDFLGDVRIDTLYPTSDGNYSQFTPSTGTSHFALVDETAPNSTDYNDGSTVGDYDSYGLSDLPALTSQTVYGVQVNAAILKDDAGTKNASTMVRSGTTNADGTSAALGTSQVYVSQLYETNPNGSIAWTEASVNAMEAGVKVTA